MDDITKIMDMLDWNMSTEVQCQGIKRGIRTGAVIPFLQPLTPKHNKNVWENCATILVEKNDEELTPYLVQLLEWIQDMNWPGAFYIFNRLQKYSNNILICNAIQTSIQKAKSCSDKVWEDNLKMLYDTLNIG